MPVERVDYYSDDEYEHALAFEAQPQEPDVVQCFKCGGAMYDVDQLNMCPDCRAKQVFGEN